MMIRSKITHALCGQVLRRNPNEPLQYIVPRLLDAKPTVSFNAIKSNIIGRLVNVQGNVIRVGPSKPLVQSCHFMCPKCGTSIYQSKQWACECAMVSCWLTDFVVCCRVRRRRVRPAHLLPDAEVLQQILRAAQRDRCDDGLPACEGAGD